MDKHLSANQKLWDRWTTEHEKFPFIKQGDDGWWRLPKEYVQIPFLFSLQVRKK